MPNLSQLKRQRMLEFLNKIKAEHTDDESLIAINEIEAELTEKKYGLVWEEHEERVDIEMQTKVPVFTEVVDKEIVSDKSLPYNFLLEGDNLHSLKLLEKTHKGKIDIIYIDPPYNTENKDFIYDDVIVEAEDSFKHSKWLSFMASRLKLAKNILKATGCIFISIDNNEFAQLKLLADDIFGENTFVTTIHIEMSATQGMKVKAAKQGNIVKNGEFILVYKMDGTKNVGKIPLTDPVKYDVHYNSFLINEGEYYSEIPLAEAISKEHTIIESLSLLGLLDKKSKLSNKNIAFAYDKCDNFKEWVNAHANEICRTHDSVAVGEDVKNNMLVNKVYPYNSDSRSYLLSKNDKGEVFQRILLADKLSIADDFYCTYGPTKIRGDWWSGFYLDMGNISKEGNVEFLNGKKPKRLIKQIIKFAMSSPDDTVLDFFAGSGTTGHAVMELNAEDSGHRKFILCTNNENNICEEVTYKRLSGVIDKERYGANLKYYKTDFIKKTSDDEDYSVGDKLLNHIAEMVQLQYAVKLDGTNYVLLMSDDEADAFIDDSEKLENCKAVYISTAVLLTAEQQKVLSNRGIASYVIPDYYFESELLEVRER